MFRLELNIPDYLSALSLDYSNRCGIVVMVIDREPWQITSRSVKHLVAQWLNKTVPFKSIYESFRILTQPGQRLRALSGLGILGGIKY
ncbi:hypothetical protein QL285_056289 [Trifolium repens]|jgi:hypothetical protein|nr:hypothetical protein QL285_056289 [Trifolium repens]